jgi:hypothetical protein
MLKVYFIVLINNIFIVHDFISDTIDPTGHSWDVTAVINGTPELVGRVTLGDVTVLDTEVAKSFAPGFVIPLGHMLEGEILPGDPTTHRNLYQGTLISVTLLPDLTNLLADPPQFKVDPSETCL